MVTIIQYLFYLLIALVFLKLFFPRKGGIVLGILMLVLLLVFTHQIGLLELLFELGLMIYGIYLMISWTFK